MLIHSSNNCLHTTSSLNEKSVNKNFKLLCQWQNTNSNKVTLNAFAKFDQIQFLKLYPRLTQKHITFFIVFGHHLKRKHDLLSFHIGLVVDVIKHFLEESRKPRFSPKLKQHE